MTERVGSQLYLVKLSEYLRAIYPVFHISQLEPALSSNILNCSNLPSPPIKLDGNLEFEVAQILDSKWDRQRMNPLLYYICWARYEGTSEEYSWLSSTDLGNASELIQEFHMLNPTKPGPNNLPLTT